MQISLTRPPSPFLFCEGDETFSSATRLTKMKRGLYVRVCVCAMVVDYGVTVKRALLLLQGTSAVGQEACQLPLYSHFVL